MLKLSGGLMTVGVALIFLAEWQMASLVNRAMARKELVRTRVSEIRHDGFVTVIFPDAEPGQRPWPSIVVSTDRAKALRSGDPLTFPRIRQLFPVPNRIPLEAWFDPAEIAALNEFAFELDEMGREAATLSGSSARQPSSREGKQTAKHAGLAPRWVE